MQKIDRMIAGVKRTAQIDEERRKDAEIKEAIGRMSMDQLRELAYKDPSEERVKGLFLSVGLDMDESW